MYADVTRFVKVKKRRFALRNRWEWCLYERAEYGDTVAVERPILELVGELHPMAIRITGRAKTEAEAEHAGTKALESWRGTHGL